MNRALIRSSLILWALAALAAGCSSKPVAATSNRDLPALLGRRITITGRAVHSCPGAVVFDKDGQVSVEGVKYWPTNYERHRVRVTGVLQLQHNPELYVI